MASFYVVIGITKDPTRVWPVTASVDRADCERNVEVCKAEAAAYIAELTPIWKAMEDLGVEPSPVIYRAGRRVTNSRYDQDRLIHATKRERYELQEHEINIKYRDSMLDALFPTGNDGWCPEVEYVIWTMYEDIRSELTPAALMLMRAKLHANEEADAIYDEGADEE